ncbi:MAG TPA: MOFRL family protein, partial [Vicinamibacterales bacterium]|nr:MOFRL family protein [Vicinamibacterales bacterium]
LAVASKATTETLAISDVVGDDLAVIASGPTVGDPSTFRDASDILACYGVRAGNNTGIPDRVLAHMRRGLDGDLVDTPTPERVAQHNLMNRAMVIGGRHTAMRGAADEAHRLGFHVVTIEAAVVGEARPAAARHAQRVKELATTDLRRPLCVVSSGETTVHVRGKGRGGRNQEFALAFSETMAGSRLAWCAASAGTDGVDGPTDAAGAIVDPGTPARAALAGLEAARAFLDDNNAYAFFHATGDLINTGPTGTNVGDIQIILID